MWGVRWFWVWVSRRRRLISIHPSMRASEWSVCVDICTDLRRERDGLAVAPELHLLGQVLA